MTGGVSGDFNSFLFVSGCREGYTSGNEKKWKMEKCYGDYGMNAFRWNYLTVVRDTVARCLLEELRIVRIIANSTVLNRGRGYELRR